MRIGIVSDTHDKVDPLRSALRQLQDLGAQYFIHCGDVGGQDVLDAFAGLPLTFIWGNNDWDVTSLEQYASLLGLSCGGRSTEVTLDGKIFAITHGDNALLKRAVLTDQRVDYLLQGHTHHFDDQRVGRIRLINPGALYRAPVKTVALLDTATDRLDRIVVG
jgi:putative phosphoesterase